ncbi:hypothetical protein B566_EDAN016125 [Ephemera danica]|nr:hypothetical protein B566_EDAN016125 [Ephemera danica]
MNPAAQENTRLFLHKLVEILTDYVRDTSDRNEKVLHFRHPADMKAALDLDLPDHAVNLQQLLEDCSVTLKNQVKTVPHPRKFVITNSRKLRLVTRFACSNKPLVVDLQCPPGEREVAVYRGS